ncbi:MAG TPA: hypothetical protein VK558_04950 [Patescibacteria group bacterium]|nr:hypothetical protein [Patescibacteria group bacterium]
MNKHSSTDKAEPQEQKPSHRVVHSDGTVEYLSRCDIEECVDTSSADSFPASDPPSFTPTAHPGRPHRKPH